MSKFVKVPVSKINRERWAKDGLSAILAACPDGAQDDDDACDTILAVLHYMHTGRGYGSAGIEQILDRVTSSARRERILSEV